MVPVGSSVMLELVLAVHSYHVIAYLGIKPVKGLAFLTLVPQQYLYIIFYLTKKTDFYAMIISLEK